MPPPLLLDLASLDLGRVVLSREEIYQRLPQRYEFMLLDGVSFIERDPFLLVAFANIEESAWWARGHVPGQPLLPGVLMLEMAAHAATVLVMEALEFKGFFGFGAIDQCKFRQAVSPPARLDILCKLGKIRPNRFVGDTQCVVDGRLVFEARITGLAMK